MGFSIDADHGLQNVEVDEEVYKKTSKFYR